MAFERRLQAVVIGPGKPGQVRVALGHGERKFVADVPFTMLEPGLRMPNSEFVAVVSGRDFVRVEPAGRIWLTIQDQIRVVLSTSGFHRFLATKPVSSETNKAERGQIWRP